MLLGTSTTTTATTTATTYRHHHFTTILPLLQAHRWKYTSVWRRIFDALTCGCSAAKKGPPIKEGFRPVCKRAPEPTDLLWQHASKAARENGECQCCLHRHHRHHHHHHLLLHIHHHLLQ